MTTFASFTYPKFLGDMPTKPLDQRLGHFKVSPKKSWLTGYRQEDPGNGKPDGKSFYLESDFMPGLRWAWADLVYSGIRHTGWFTDEYGDSDKVRGLVMQLPHERGWLAGWSYGENMISFVEYEIYGDKWTAARRADRMAQEAAEKEREHEEQERAENCPTCKTSIPAADFKDVNGEQIYVGSRVEIGPNYDLWMRGARCGVVTKLMQSSDGQPAIKVCMDKLNKRYSFIAADCKRI